MSDSTVPTSKPEDPKQDARNARLSVRRNGEDLYRKKLQEIARQKCSAEMKAFGECTNREGLMVVFKCRELVGELNSCMNKYYNEEELVKFIRQEGQDPDVVLKYNKQSWLDRVTK